jgi:hypothetical protein
VLTDGLRGDPTRGRSRFGVGCVHGHNGPTLDPFRVGDAVSIEHIERFARRAYASYMEQIQGSIYRPWERLPTDVREGWREAVRTVLMLEAE